MNDTFAIKMGERGRVVVPAAVRERAGFTEGVTLMLLETPDGVVLMTREQLLARVRRDFGGLNLVDDLLAERRLTSAAEDADMAVVS